MKNLTLLSFFFLFRSRHCKHFKDPVASIHPSHVDSLWLGLPQQSIIHSWAAFMNPITCWLLESTIQMCTEWASVCVSGTWLHDGNERRKWLDAFERFRGFLERSADSEGTGFLVQMLLLCFFYSTCVGVCMFLWVCEWVSASWD